MIMNTVIENYPKDYQFKLRIIDENAECLYSALGISEERAQELQKVCQEAFKAHDLKTHVYQMAFDECVHINEITFCFEVIQHIHELHSNKAQMQELIKRLGKMFQNGEE